jgi:RNA recognition motif-containing protein
MNPSNFIWLCVVRRATARLESKWIHADLEYLQHTFRKSSTLASLPSQWNKDRLSATGRFQTIHEHKGQMARRMQTKRLHLQVRSPSDPGDHHITQEIIMGKKLYVGNLSFDVDDKTMEELFTAYGTVESANVINDRRTGQSKGFGFVEMSSNEEAKAAISGLDGKEHGGRALKVNEAKPREDRSGGQERGGGGYGGQGRFGRGEGYGGGEGRGSRGGGGGGYGRR